jgi:sugar/nucleoside kinase (ribokinase family)
MGAHVALGGRNDHLFPALVEPWTYGQNRRHGLGDRWHFALGDSPLHRSSKRIRLRTSTIPVPIHAQRRFDVTLAGDANLDLILYGLPEELPRERELLASEMQIHLGGSAAITAHNLAALGNSVGFVSTNAGDHFASLCQMGLSRAGVDVSRCVPTPHATTGVTVLVQNRDFRRMLTYPGATFHLNYDSLDLKYLADARHFHMSSYFLQRSLTPRIPELFAGLKQAGLTISLDPNDDPDCVWDRGVLEALRFVDILMPNEREVCLLADERDVNRAIARLTEIVPLLIVKRGAGGASAHTPTRSWQVASRPVDVVDAVGAGDSFNAGFLHAWLRGSTIEQALAHGNFTGAWSTTAAGGTSAFSDSQMLCKLESAWQHMQEP